MPDYDLETNSFIECLNNFYLKESDYLQIPTVQAKLSQKLVESLISVLHYIEVISINLSNSIIDPMDHKKTTIELILNHLDKWRSAYNKSPLFIVLPHIEEPLRKSFVELPLASNKSNHPDILERLYFAVVSWRLAHGQ